MEDRNKNEIEKVLFKNGLSFSITMACFHTGTSMCTVKHPVYGKHRLDTIQMKTSSAEYKNALYKDMVKTLAQDIDLFGLEDSTYFKLLDRIQQQIVRKNLRGIETF